jgi:hypothetical protein
MPSFQSAFATFAHHHSWHLLRCVCVHELQAEASLTPQATKSPLQQRQQLVQQQAAVRPDQPARWPRAATWSCSGWQTMLG